MFQKRRPTCLMNVAQICWMLRGDHSQEEKDLLDHADTWFRCDSGVFSQTFRLDISQSQLISDGQTTCVQGQPWSNSGSSEVPHQGAHRQHLLPRGFSSFGLCGGTCQHWIERGQGAKSRCGFDVLFFFISKVTFECFFLVVWNVLVRKWFKKHFDQKSARLEDETLLSFAVVVWLFMSQFNKETRPLLTVWKFGGFKWCGMSKNHSAVVGQPYLQYRSGCWNR